MDAQLEDKMHALNVHSNPLLIKARIPGETFPIPSRGLMYNNGEIDPSVQNGEIIVNPMVTLDEIYMRTPDMLLNGTSIVKVFNHCIPQVIKPLELFSKDVDFLLVCLRKITYGDIYNFKYKHECNIKTMILDPEIKVEFDKLGEMLEIDNTQILIKTIENQKPYKPMNNDEKLIDMFLVNVEKKYKEYNYEISLDQFLRNSKKIDKNALKSYIVTLPNGQVVSLVPPRYQKILEFYQSFNNPNSSIEELSESLFNSILGMISNVDKIDDKELINQWLREVPAGYINIISSKIAEIGKWGPDMGVSIKCKNCSETIDTQISLNPIDFFF